MLAFGLNGKTHDHVVMLFLTDYRSVPSRQSTSCLGHTGMSNFFEEITINPGSSD